MRLSLWTYEGPPHIGAMRIASSLRNVHYVLHAPQGDTYADLLFTMIERQGRRPPVTYTTFQARDLGADTAELVMDTVRDSVQRFQPEVLLVGESCTAELLQDQPGALASQLQLDIPIVPVELPAYSRKENWGASETFYQIVRSLLRNSETPERNADAPAVNILGPADLCFRARDNALEISRLLESVGVRVNVVAPLGATPADLLNIPAAQANICLYPEVASTVCRWLERQFGQTTIHTVPLGVSATQQFLAELGEALGITLPEPPTDSRLPWYSRSVDSTYLTGKEVFVFGDATHACAAARIATHELGFKVVGLGTYAREFAKPVRALAEELGVPALVTDDYMEVEQAIAAAGPELVLGTQMERHIAKRLGIPCAVICAPFHVEDCPARYSPTMGHEGANVLFDTWVHPLMMGLEEHLLGMFRGDFEFGNDVQPSHLGHGGGVSTDVGVTVESLGTEAEQDAGRAEQDPAAASADDTIVWTDAASAELQRVPFFVRRKAARNTELYAQEQGISRIEVETLYDAKAHFAS